MSDELHRHAAITIDGFLERKDDEDTIGELSNRGEPTRPPRPDLRADVVHDRDTEAPDASRQPEVEIRKIDDDQGIRALVAGGGGQRAERRERSRQLGDGLGQPGDGEPAIIRDQPSACRGELRPAEAEQHDRRVERA